MATIKLDTIRENVSRKYAPLVIELDADNAVSLRQVIRLSKAERDALTKLQADRVREAREAERNEKARLARVEAGEVDDSDLSDTSDESLLSYFKAFIKLVADSPAGAEALFAALDDDVAILGEIVTEYSESTQVGEASSSES